METEKLLLFAESLEYPTFNLFKKIKNLKLESLDEKLIIFINFINKNSFSTLEELYTSTFDLNPIACLYLGFHLYGESYKRGEFMASLIDTYKAEEFIMQSNNELPDFLPQVLRFISFVKTKDKTLPIIENILLPALKKIIETFGENSSNAYSYLLLSLKLFLEENFLISKKEVIKTC